MASLAVALALGVRRYEENSTPVPEAVRTEKMAVPSFESYSLAATSENDRQRDPADVRGDSDHLPKNSTDTTAEDAVVRASMVDKTGRSRQRDGLIARDTVTYLDASRRPAPKAQPAKGVAANTVTYLSKPIPKPAK
jgi:hypothetical protein